MRLSQLEITVLQYLFCCNGVTKERLRIDLDLPEPVAHLVLLQLHQKDLIKRKEEYLIPSGRARDGKNKIPDKVNGNIELDI